MSDKILVIIAGNNDEFSEKVDWKAEIETLKTNTIPMSLSKVYLIGGVFKPVDVSNEENIVVIPTSASWLFEHPINDPGPIYMPFLFKHYRSPFHVLIDHIRTTEMHVTYASLSKDVASNPYDLASLVKTSKVGDKRQWIIKLNPTSINDIFNEKRYTIPDIFGGTSVTLKQISNLKGYEQHQFNNFIIQAIDTLRFWLNAGFHLHRNVKPIMSFAASVYSSWQSILIGVFKIVPGMVDENHQIAFLQSAQYRGLMTRITVYVLSNLFVFMIKNELIENTITRLKLDSDNIIAEERTKWNFSDSEIMNIYGYTFDNNTEYQTNLNSIIFWSSSRVWNELRSSFSKLM